MLWTLHSRVNSLLSSNKAFPRSRSNLSSSRRMSIVLAEKSTQIPKDHSSAICLIPPTSTWGPIQDIRCFNDKGFVRWPPHVNLLYPFWRDNPGSENFQDAAELATEALSKLKPFQVTLSKFKYFEHGRSCTLWLEPEGEEMLRLQSALVEAFPECRDLSDDPKRGITSFTPHLSVGQWRSLDEARTAQRELEAKWRPVSFQVDQVALISRKSFSQPFQIRHTVPLGGGQSASCVNAAYVATAGPLDQPPVASAGVSDRLIQPVSASCSVEDSAGMGLGLLNENDKEGVWNFAYGANMAKEKLSGARGLHPLESKAGVLRGYRLSFSHRGGMGNVVPSPGTCPPSPTGTDEEMDLNRKFSEEVERQDAFQWSKTRLEGVHGLLHRLSTEEMASLTNMEHEYIPRVLPVHAYDGSIVRAVVFQSPPERLIKNGLPPISRYLNLLQTGARDWELNKTYCEWLESMPQIESRHRGDEYYTSWVDGEKFGAWPKVRVGTEQKRKYRGSKRKTVKDV